MSHNQILVPDSVIEAYPGLFQEWYSNRRLVAYRPTQMNASILEAWSALIVKTIQEWDRTTPYLALHDISAPSVTTLYASLTSYDILNIGITQTGKIRVEDIFNEHPGFIARVAISFNMMLSGHIGKALLNHYTDKHPAVQYKSYYSREKSLQWLGACVDQQGRNPVGAKV